MNQTERAAWFQMTISIAAICIALSLYPWLGDRAVGAFGILGLIGFIPLFFIRRTNQVTSDERDAQILMAAMGRGAFMAFLMLNLFLVFVINWAEYSRFESVSIGLLSWLVWIQVAIFHGMSGLLAVVQYRKQSRAT